MYKNQILAHTVQNNSFIKLAYRNIELKNYRELADLSSKTRNNKKIIRADAQNNRIFKLEIGSSELKIYTKGKQPKEISDSFSGLALSQTILITNKMTTNSRQLSDLRIINFPHKKVNRVVILAKYDILVFDESGTTSSSEKPYSYTCCIEGNIRRNYTIHSQALFFKIDFPYQFP